MALDILERYTAAAQSMYKYRVPALVFLVPRPPRERLLLLPNLKPEKEKYFTVSYVPCLENVQCAVQLVVSLYGRGLF